jgi:cytosine/adenosine deaminase-related metal-dependent hydrolase
MVDLEITTGAIAQITAAGTEASSQLADIPVVDCRGGLVFPCFVYAHPFRQRSCLGTIAQSRWNFLKRDRNSRR